jgi:hypothetical protein
MSSFKILDTRVAKFSEGIKDDHVMFTPVISCRLYPQHPVSLLMPFNPIEYSPCICLRLKDIDVDLSIPHSSIPWHVVWIKKARDQPTESSSKQQEKVVTLIIIKRSFIWKFHQSHASCRNIIERVRSSSRSWEVFGVSDDESQGRWGRRTRRWRRITCHIQSDFDYLKRHRDLKGL